MPNTNEVPGGAPPSKIAFDKTAIFVDANVWLSFYKSKKIASLVGTLTAVQARLLVTTQVANEVSRNSVKVASDLLNEQIKKLHVSDVLDFDVAAGGADPGGGDQAIRDALALLKEKIGPYSKKVVVAALQQISDGEDQVSKLLSPFLTRAVDATPEQLARARVRKERGSPPGKRDDPLGDQISWEQLLDVAKRAKAVWIVTDDQDFATHIESEAILNAALASELRAAGVTRAFVFRQLGEALKHFSENTESAPALALPDDAELKRIAADEHRASWQAWTAMIERERAMRQQWEQLANLGGATIPRETLDTIKWLRDALEHVRKSDTK